MQESMKMCYFMFFFFLTALRLATPLHEKGEPRFSFNHVLTHNYMIRFLSNLLHGKQYAKPANPLRVVSHSGVKRFAYRQQLVG